LEIWVIYPPENEGNPSNHSSSPSMSTYVGHSENPDEATLVQQHTEPWCSSTQINLDFSIAVLSLRWGTNGSVLTIRGSGNMEGVLTINAEAA
jgi:hypothetical protein